MAENDHEHDDRGRDNRECENGIVLTEQQQRRRRARSIAIALVLGALVVLFYVVTIVKLGPGVLRRPL
jgi:predicted nucleic acid-binding Zn ribbon protein